ncbi:hypothetical protein [Borrelia hermsii]|uniref:Uncharacterized protein n=3 Tax=Borrelia hermsii TaxID=140 RepID=S4VUC7_BORHE|nr:hypothetical protein [Borrelia hermsii]ADD52198.1 hypothetical protein BHA065 [Borrelia hermsii HS1]AGO68822.1 hypothetical protein BHA065 [Borrelia hermsii]AMR75900.1 hypothetical protein A0V01_04620 [Borrelia hermsii]ANA43706.1 hypothetical protein AXX13_A0310 [Borrelia hermsii HS1]UCP01931.1 hypothetical protein K9R62_04660 [Borrelia hermsii]
MAKRDQVFNELQKILVEFREELENERAAFILKEAQLNINFKGTLEDIVYYQSDRDKIYTMLGYDVEVIGKLGGIFDRLNLKHVGDRDTRIVINLLNGLMRVAYSIQIIFRDILNQTKLDMLKFRDTSDLEKIIQYLVHFIEMVKDLMLQVRVVIASAASKTNENDILRELNRVISSPDAKINRGMRNICYLLFDIIELVDLL